MRRRPARKLGEQFRRAVVRGVVGALFLGHGTQKLFGWFGGNGLEGTGAFFESLGLRPGKRHAIAAGASEALGGALLAAGFLTPLAGSLLSGSMVTAIRKVHAARGPWATQGGYEYNLVLIVLLFALVDAGPGDWSLDKRLSLDLSGPGWAMGELLAAVAGSSLTIAAAERRAGEEPAE